MALIITSHLFLLLQEVKPFGLIIMFREVLRQILPYSGNLLKNTFPISRMS